MVKEFKGEFVTGGKVLYCSVCNEPVSYDRKSQVTQHRSSKKHTTSTSTNAPTQQLVSNIESTVKKPKAEDYNEKLCRAIVAGYILFNKLKNKTFSSFLEEFTGMKTPDESTLRKNYLLKLKLYENTGKQYVTLYMDQRSGYLLMRGQMPQEDPLPTSL